MYSLAERFFRSPLNSARLWDRGLSALLHEPQQPETGLYPHEADRRLVRLRDHLEWAMVQLGDPAYAFRPLGIPDSHLKTLQRALDGLKTVRGDGIAVRGCTLQKPTVMPTEIGYGISVAHYPVFRKESDWSVFLGLSENIPARLPTGFTMNVDCDGQVVTTGGFLFAENYLTPRAVANRFPELAAPLIEASCTLGRPCDGVTAFRYDETGWITDPMQAPQFTRLATGPTVAVFMRVTGT
jgi:hypothetical protein